MDCPSELRTAAERGVAKLFPAHIGGVAYLQSRLAVLPGARIVAIGAVTVDNTALWLGSDAFTVSKGSGIRGKANRLRTLLDGWAASRGVPGARGAFAGRDRLDDQPGGPFERSKWGRVSI
ncbi:hypothetical protein [Streptomyces sp. NPDC056982]|uniref:hypothetical protein n=1 Tax=Streptomyces sp. NPDC056982 TaxID=3345986 RepID=UPI00362E1DFA